MFSEYKCRYETIKIKLLIDFLKELNFQAEHLNFISILIYTGTYIWILEYNFISNIYSV